MAIVAGMHVIAAAVSMTTEGRRTRRSAEPPHRYGGARWGGRTQGATGWGGLGPDPLSEARSAGPDRATAPCTPPPRRPCGAREAGAGGAMSGAVVITMPGSAGCRPPGRGPRGSGYGVRGSAGARRPPMAASPIGSRVGPGPDEVCATRAGRYLDAIVAARERARAAGCAHEAVPGSAGASARPRGARRPARARLFDCAYMNSPASREYVQRESAFLSVGAAETDRSEGAHAQHTRIRPHRAERAYPQQDR